MTFWGGLVVPTTRMLKVRLGRDRVTTGARAVAVRLTLGSEVALLVTVTLPLRVPALVGVKVTLTVQLLPAARLAGQVLVSAKSPLAPILVMDKAAFPEFISVTFRAELVVPA